MNEYQMRRKDRAITDEETKEILKHSEYGFLATAGADGNPYGVPISFIFMNDAIYIHCAKQGRKLANFKFNPNVQFTAVRGVKAVFTHNFTTYFESAMAFGKIVLVENDEEKTEALRQLCKKYLPFFADLADKYIQQSWDKTAVYRIDISQISGKAKKTKPDAKS